MPLSEFPLALLGLAVLALIMAAGGFALTAFEPAGPNRTRGRYLFRSAALGGFVGGAAGLVLDFALGLPDVYVTEWLLMTGTLVWLYRAARRWPAAHRH